MDLLRTSANEAVRERPRVVEVFIGFDLSARPLDRRHIDSLSTIYFGGPTGDQILTKIRKRYFLSWLNAMQSEPIALEPGFND